MKNKHPLTHLFSRILPFLLRLPSLIVFYLLFQAEKLHQRFRGDSGWKVAFLNQKRMRNS